MFFDGAKVNIWTYFNKCRFSLVNQCACLTLYFSHGLCEIFLGGRPT